MADMPISSWNWRKAEYYTPAAALKAEYPDLLRKDPILSVAAAQIEIAERAIDARMQELTDVDEEG